MEEQIVILTEENSRLQKENNAISDDLEMAANFGKTLLESNKEYETRMEEISDDYAAAMTNIEKLKQENYTLRSRVESECRTKENHAFELESLKERHRQEFENEAKLAQMASEKKIKQLRQEIESLQSDSSKHALIEDQLREKIKKQEEMLIKAHEYNEQLQCKVPSDSETEEQRNLCNQLKCERDSLKLELSDLKHAQERLVFDYKAVTQKHEVLEEEYGERTRQSQAWFGCLQEARQDAGDLKAELDLLRAEQVSREHKEKGNSLFGEVEDKRLELERNYVGLKAQHECLNKTYAVTKQHLHRLKNQVATLLQVKGCHADASQIQRLRQALAQKEGEVKMLIQKTSSLEKQQVASSPSVLLKEFHDAFSDFGDKKDYVRFLEMQLKDTKNAITNLKKEMQTKTLLYLSEGDNLRHTERQLHCAESTVERLNSDNMKLKLKIDNLKMKLHTESLKANKEGEVRNTSKLSKETRGLTKSKSTGSMLKASPRYNAAALQESEEKNHNPDMTSDLNQVTKEIRSLMKSKSTGSILKSTMDPGQESLPSMPMQKPSVSFCGTSQGPVKPVQKVVPFIGTRKSVSFEPQAQRIGGESEESTGINPVHAATMNDVSLIENSDPEVHHNQSATMSEPAHALEASIGVRGQTHAPTVIHVKRGAARNECAQQ